MKLDKFFTYFWLIIVAICFVLIGFSIAYPATNTNKIGLEWDANTEPDLAGYEIYVSYDAGGPYTLIGTTDKDVTEFWWYNILSDGNYYFVVKAFNDEGLKSDYSNEVCGYIDPDKDYGIECGTEYPNEDGSSHGCFINVLNSPCS